MGKNKYKIQNTQIIRELKGYEKGKNIPVIEESVQLTCLQVRLEEANLSRNLLMVTTCKVKFEPDYSQGIKLGVLI